MQLIVGLLVLVATLCLGAAAYVCGHASQVEIRNSLMHALGPAERGKAVRSPAKRERATSPQGARLHSAGIDIDPKMWALVRAAGSFFAFVFVFMFSSNLVFGAAAFVAVFAGAAFFVRAKAKRMRLLLAEQLGAALPQVAENVRSGLTPDNAFRAVTGHMEDPLREELIRVNAEVSYGRTLGDALAAMADRTGNRDLYLLATAVDFARENGGNLSGSLDKTAEAVVEKLGMLRHLKAITSGTSMAKWIVAALPWLAAVVYAAFNPEFQQFWASPAGTAVIVAVVVLEAVGIVVMNRIADLKLD